MNKKVGPAYLLEISKHAVFIGNSIINGIYCSFDMENSKVSIIYDAPTTEELKFFLKSDNGEVVIDIRKRLEAFLKANSNRIALAEEKRISISEYKLNIGGNTKIKIDL